MATRLSTVTPDNVVNINTSSFHGHTITISAYGEHYKCTLPITNNKLTTRFGWKY